MAVAVGSRNVVRRGEVGAELGERETSLQADSMPVRGTTRFSRRFD